MDLFPSKYIHIGGDEVPKRIWHNSVFCRNLIKKLKLRNEHGLQSYFIGRIEKFLNEHGRNIIGWDEILQGGLAPNATVMSWRGESGGIAAAKLNHDVIMTSQYNGLYFDKAQSKSDQEPASIGGYAPLKLTYSYNPVSGGFGFRPAKIHYWCAGQFVDRIHCLHNKSRIYAAAEVASFGRKSPGHRSPIKTIVILPKYVCRGICCVWMRPVSITACQNLLVLKIR